MVTVKQPLFLVETGRDSIIHILDVPFVTRYADPEWRFSAICQPFTPATEGSWRDPDDVNLVSLYGIKVSGTYKEGSADLRVVVDASKAKVPEHYPFTLDQVIDSTVTCVKLMYPPRPKEEGLLEIEVVR